MEHLDTFLARHPPFDGIDPQHLKQLAAEATEQRAAPGDVVLVEDGAPAPGVWVILTGSMELVHEGEVIQVLEPGECFGHPSLLTGMAPAFTARARERSRCALLAAAPARAALGTEAGAAYVAATLRKRMVRQGHTVHGLLDVGTTPVSAILRPPVWCEPGEPVRALVQRLGVDGVSALLVSLPSGELGLVSDAEI